MKYHVNRSNYVFSELVNRAHTLSQWKIFERAFFPLQKKKLSYEINADEAVVRINEMHTIK